MKIIKGENLEEQMKHVDRLLKSYSRRLHKTVVGVITPFPISNYSDAPVGDVVLRYMFPMNGEITIGGMFVEVMPKKGINIDATIHRGDKIESRNFFSKRKVIAVEFKTKLSAGDRLVVKAVPVETEGIVLGIWTAFLWTPEVEGSITEQFLIDDLDRIEKMDNALIEEREKPEK